MAELLRTPEEWVDILGVRIDEPNGWTEGTDALPFDQPIDHAEFMHRLWWSEGAIILPTGGEIAVRVPNAYTRTFG